MAPRVEIIVPTYNRAHLVGRAIESVLRQDYPHKALIIVDDGSTDDTARILDRFKDHPLVRIVRHQRNLGVTAAKNDGLENLSPDADYFCQDPVTGEITGALDGSSGLDCFVTYEDALTGRFRGEFWQLVQRNALGDLRFDVRAAGGEASVWHVMLKTAPGRIIPTVVRYYDRSGLDRVSRDAFDRATSERKMWTYQSVLNAVGSDMRTLSPARYSDTELEIAKWALLAGRRVQALKAFWAAIQATPSNRAVSIGLQLLLPASLLRWLRTRRAKQREVTLPGERQTRTTTGRWSAR